MFNEALDSKKGWMKEKPILNIFAVVFMRFSTKLKRENIYKGLDLCVFINGDRY